MRVLTVTCDRCKTEIDKTAVRNGQVWEIAVTRNGDKQQMAEWCRSCTIEMGLLNQGGKEETKQPRIDPPPTIEDFIREIVREEINQ